MHTSGHQPTPPTTQPSPDRPAKPLVEVVRSTARRRTSSARVRDGRIVVRLPAHLTDREASRAVTDLLARLRAKAEAVAPHSSLPRRVGSRPTREQRGPRGDRYLVARADEVAAKWLGDHGVRAASVRWSHRMTTRWASCTVPPGRIRVSHRLADAPDVVLDVLLLHELAHVVVSGHGPEFHALAGRHPQHADVDAWLARRTHDDLRIALGLPPT